MPRNSGSISGGRTSSFGSVAWTWWLGHRASDPDGLAGFVRVGFRIRVSGMGSAGFPLSRALFVCACLDHWMVLDSSAWHRSPGMETLEAQIDDGKEGFVSGV